MPNKNFTNFTESTSPGQSDFFVGYLDGGAINSESKIKYSNLGVSSNTANRLVLRDSQGNFNANRVTLNQITANNPTGTAILLDGYTSINTTTRLDVLSVNGTIYIEAGTSNYQSSVVSLANRTNTYITLGTGGSSNDWAYIRQIGSTNNFTLSIDLHDDANGSSGQGFAIRSIASSVSEPDPEPVTNFYISPDGNTEMRNSLTVNKSLTDQSALFISDQGGIHDFRTGYMNICFTEGIRLWSGKLSPTPISNTLSFFKDGSILANGGVTASRIDATNLVGMIAYFAHTNVDPAGWQECNGAGIPTGSGYEYIAALRAYIINGGRAYGVDEFDNPRIPDLRGRFIRSNSGGTWRDQHSINVTTTANSNIAVLNNPSWINSFSPESTSLLVTEWLKNIIIGSTVISSGVIGTGALAGAVVTAVNVEGRTITFNRTAAAAVTGNIYLERSAGSYQRNSYADHGHDRSIGAAGSVGVTVGINWTSNTGIPASTNQRGYVQSIQDPTIGVIVGTPTLNLYNSGTAIETRPENISFKAYIKY